MFATFIGLVPLPRIRPTFFKSAARVNNYQQDLLSLKQSESGSPVRRPQLPPQEFIPLNLSAVRRE